jgi:hypothetical protein
MDEFSHLDKQTAWRKRHPDGFNEIQQRKRQRDRAWVSAQKAVPCMDCGGSFPPECMDFDHVHGKKSFNVGARPTTSRKNLLREIAKCDVVCANCHRTRTAARRKR